MGATSSAKCTRRGSWSRCFKRPWLISALAGCLAFAGWASANDQPPLVKIKPAQAITLKKGDRAEVALSVTVEKGFHVQANPATEKYLIPTTLTVPAVNGIEPGLPLYPEPKPHKMKGAEKAIATYDGTFEIRVPVKAGPAAKTGLQKLPAKLKYQACNDHTCFFPKTAELTFEVKVTP